MEYFQGVGQMAPGNDEEGGEKENEDLVTQSSEGAVSPAGELSDELSDTAEQAGMDRSQVCFI